MAEINFIDYCKIFCSSGKGGDGSAHLHRAKYIPKGGPDGGDGGRGGHIILRVDKQLSTLVHLKYRKHVRANDGQKGCQHFGTGKSAEDIYLDVPQGTVVRNADTGAIITEMLKPDEHFILCRGGEGGRGNNRFKSAENRTPREFEPGGENEEGWFVFELKVLADVGLVGFPNAGKSTLLATVSAAKPKIAGYPFTTLKPQLGVVSYRDKKSFVMADIPGIIGGAHEGKGLGLRFLRHIERNSVLLFVISCEEANVGSAYTQLLNELRMYDESLLSKPRVVAISKCDIASKDFNVSDALLSLPKDIPVVFMSSLTGTGINKLKDTLWTELHR